MNSSSKKNFGIHARNVNSRYLKKRLSSEFKQFSRNSLPIKLALLFISITIFSSICNAGNQNFIKPLMVSKMKSEKDLSQWVDRPMSKGLVTWQLATDPETKKKCFLFVTPTADKVIYPGMNLPMGNGEPIDISHYTEIVFQAKNVGPGEPPLQLVMIDDKGVARYGYWVIKKKGWHTYRVDIPKAFKERKLAQIQFGYDTPKINYKIYLSNLRIENNDFTISFDLLSKKVKANQSSLSPELLKKYENLRTELKEFSKKTEQQTLKNWLDSVMKLDKEIYKYLTSLAIEKFDSLNKDATWGYAWANSATKVFRTDNIFEGTFNKVGQVSLAANEYEGIQLVLRSKQKVSDVKVSVSDLTSESGAKITADDIQVLPVGYVNTKRPPYEVDYVGWWPDPLLDFLKTFELDADVWQPVWLDIYAQPKQEPGLYKGTITVSGTDMKTLEIPLEVKVWNFEVPHKKNFPLALNWFDGTEGVDIFKSQYCPNNEDFSKYQAYLRGQVPLSEVTGGAAQLLKLREKFQKTIIDHRLNPLRIYNETPPLTSDVKLLKEAGFDDYCMLMIWSQRQLEKGDPYPADKKAAYMKQLEEAVPRLKQAGLLDGAFVYGFDECEENEFAAIKDIFSEIKKRWPELKTMTTAYDYTYGIKTGLADVIDIWVPLTQKYDKTMDQIKLARQRGEEVWWYVCMGPEHPYANWFVEYSAAEHRLLMGFMPWKFKSPGFLHYSLNYWKTGPVHTSYPEHLNKGPLTNYDGKSWGDTNGDGLIIYPGDNGPIVTIRMKNIRDGLEDYEYLLLLKNQMDLVKQGKKKCPEGWLAEAQEVIAIPDNVVKSLTEYSRKGSDVIEVRNKIAKLIEQVQGTNE